MKQLFILFVFLNSVSSSWGIEKIDNLFEITLNDNAEKYVSSSYIDSNKYKHPEVIEGFYNLDITDKIKTKNPHFSYYVITIDNNNRIHRVYADDELKNNDICLAVKDSLSSKFEIKYQFKFQSGEQSYSDFKISADYHYIYGSIAEYLSIQCKDVYENTSSYFQIYLQTLKLGSAIDEFYDFGL